MLPLCHSGEQSATGKARNNSPRARRWPVDRPARLAPRLSRLRRRVGRRRLRDGMVRIVFVVTGQASRPEIWIVALQASLPVAKGPVKVALRRAAVISDDPGGAAALAKVRVGAVGVDAAAAVRDVRGQDRDAPSVAGAVGREGVPLRCIAECQP